MTKRIQEAGTEVVEAKAGAGSATLSMVSIAAVLSPALCLFQHSSPMPHSCWVLEVAAAASQVRPDCFTPFFAGIRGSAHGRVSAAGYAGHDHHRVCIRRVGHRPRCRLLCAQGVLPYCGLSLSDQPCYACVPTQRLACANTFLTDDLSVCLHNSSSWARMALRSTCPWASCRRTSRRRWMRL